MNAFQRLGWGVAENSLHDLGTDLFTMARDARLFDLGLLVGVQVKAGESYFREPARASGGEVLGWWFREDDRSHVDAWLSHSLPHLIVLHDLDTAKSYWAHVTPETVQSTGEGAKVFVPRANTVDIEHREALLRVAATQRPKVAWEGSAWTGAESLAPRDELRHALVSPRLVAPHPNSGYEAPLTPAQAVALLVQCRLQDFEHFSNAHADVPDLAEAPHSPLWLWRFVGALGHRLTTGEVDILVPLIDDAPDPAARTACTIAAVAGLFEEGRADEAIPLLEAALDGDKAEPVDHAWLTVQLARAYAEVGQVDQARSAALRVQQIQVTHPDDVTASGIAGVASVILFQTSSWGHQGQEDVAEVITATDTMVALWRTQAMSPGLVGLVERTFKRWARDTAVALGEDHANKLLAASLAANHMGDHGNWRHVFGVLAEDTLLRLGRDAESETAARGLEMLRLAGDPDALRLAVGRLAADGPATAVTLAATRFGLDSSTRTTGPASLALLEHGGDVLDEDVADRSVTWLLSTLSDPTGFVARTNPSYLVEMRLVETLAAIVLAAPSDARGAVVDRLLDLEPQSNERLAASWSEVVSALPADAWTRRSALRAGERADSHHSHLRLSLLGVAAPYDEAAKAQLINEARGGSWHALAALGDIRALDTDVARQLISIAAEGVDQVVRAARGRAIGLGGPDVGYELARLNATHPSAANWDPLLSLLDAPEVRGVHKRGALQVLAALAELLPATIRSRLTDIAMTIAGQSSPTPHPLLGLFDRDPAGAAASLAMSLGVDGDVAAEYLVSLLGGDTDQRQSAAYLARRMTRLEGTGVLVTLAHDSDPRVRVAAAEGLAHIVLTEEADDIAVKALLSCLDDSGSRVPARIASVFENSVAAISPTAAAALARLRSHRSAKVRQSAARALTHRTASGREEGPGMAERRAQA